LVAIYATIAKNYYNILGRLQSAPTARYARAGHFGVGLPGCLEANLSIHILKLLIGRLQQTKCEGRLIGCFMNESMVGRRSLLSL